MAGLLNNAWYVNIPYILVVLVVTIEFIRYLVHIYKRSHFTNKDFQKRYYKELGSLLWGIIPLILTAIQYVNNSMSMIVVFVIIFEITLITRVFMPTVVYDEALCVPGKVIYWDSIISYKFLDDSESQLSFKLNEKKISTYDTCHYILKLNEEEKSIFVRKIAAFGIDKEID